MFLQRVFTFLFLQQRFHICFLMTTNRLRKPEYEKFQVPKLHHDIAMATGIDFQT